MKEVFGLYLVITNPITSYEACAEAAVKADVRYIQLRMKHVPRAAIVQAGKNLRSITRGTATHFIVNDDPFIAQEVEADGVHLGQDDMPIPAACQLFPSLSIFGLSTHNPEQLAAAPFVEPTYCGVGPVFATPTKDIPDPTLGIEQAGQMCQTSRLTTLAIGGIDLTNLAAVLTAGAENYSVVRAVCRDPAPYDAIRRLQEIWHSVRG